MVNVTHLKTLDVALQHFSLVRGSLSLHLQPGAISTTQIMLSVQQARTTFCAIFTGVAYLGRTLARMSVFLPSFIVTICLSRPELPLHIMHTSSPFLLLRNERIFCSLRPLFCIQSACVKVRDPLAQFSSLALPGRPYGCQLLGQTHQSGRKRSTKLSGTD